MKKIILTMATLLLLTGCGTNIFEDNYNKMQAGTSGMNGYMLDLGVYGTKDDKQIEDNIRITNFNGSEYKIVKVSATATDEIYIKDGVTYLLNSEGIYTQSSEKPNYTKTSLYLEGLKNTSSIDKGKVVTIGGIKYTMYNVNFKKETIKTILDDTSLKGTKVTKDGAGEVYVDNKGYIFRIVYKLDNGMITANYFNINDIKKIDFPGGIR